MRRRGFGLAAVLAVLAAIAVPAAGVLAQDTGDGPAFRVEMPDPILAGVEAEVTVTAVEPVPADATVELAVGENRYPLPIEGTGAATANAAFASGDAELRVLVNGEPAAFTLGDGAETTTGATGEVIPAWLSILPPIVAIGLALATRRVIPALLAGVWIGGWFAAELSLYGLWAGLLSVIDTWVLHALVPPDGGTGHMSIMLFTMLIGGMVGIIYKNGGTPGIVDRLSGWAKTRRRGEIVGSAVGTVVFFDDYASMLVTGNAVRPLTDTVKVSREKLAYIVDTTAAPMATLLLVTTWIGFQVGLIGDATAGLSGFEQSPYGTFLNALPYMFYPVLTVIFMWLITATGRDFGPMAKAERRAAVEGRLTAEPRGEEKGGGDEFQPREGVPHRAVNAIVPILVLLGATIAGLFATGSGESITDIIGSADSFSALLWGSLLAVIVAGAMSVAQGLLSLGETVEAWLIGVKAVLEVLVILTLAWAMSDLTQTLHTAGFLASLLGEALPAGLMPAILFVLSAAIAFAIGTSWGTMGILVPLAIPLVWAILSQQGMAGPEGLYILYASTAAVLGGAVWGDHTSPISDTTVLSSATSHCDVVDHTNTQLPYALVVGGITLVLGLLPAGYGIPWWIGMLVCLAALVAVVIFVAKPVAETPGTGATPRHGEPAGGGSPAQ
ncbi:transporter, NhaC family [Limimonas halophila]|uniref:Transporter, NhaC family n=1 Tax=Limimonas halophila TaxID=1082479 RepID=A0A1G7Q2R6_9PROT|nr:Na+/H+ antiporter NhaC family protein [Limimonas halophila]SDF91910.1 transporter, NhaC family [Limimonas halophila]